MRQIINDKKKKGNKNSYVLVRQDGRWVFTSEFIESIIGPDAEWNF